MIYGADYDKWLMSHQPFRWFVGFYPIMGRWILSSTTKQRMGGRADNGE